MIEFIVAATMRLPFLWKSTKEVCSMQGLWYSSNTTSAMVHGHAFCVII
jgi:hypothetical protein